MGIQELISQAITGLGENTVAQKGNLAEQGNIMDQIIATAQAAAPAALSVNQQKLQGELAAQEAAIATRHSLGNDISDPNSVLGILVQDFRESTIAARNQRQKVAEMQSVGLFDNPLDFLSNQVLLPGEQRKLDASQGIADQAAQSIQNMQALTTASANAFKATAQTLTKESIRAASEVQAADLANKINALRIDRLGVDYKAIDLLNSANATHLQYAMNAHSVMLQDAAAARADREFQLKLAKLKEADMEDSQYISLVNAGAASFGLPALAPSTVKMMLRSPTEKAKLDKLLDQGFSVAATGSNSVGASPGEAILNTLEVGGLQGQQNRPARDFLTGIAREALSDYQTKNGKITKMTPEIKAGISELINDKLYGPKNPKTGERLEKQGMAYKMYLNAEAPGSLLKAPDLPQLIRIPAIRSNVLFESVLKPAADAGIQSSSPEQIYGLAVAAKDKGLINDKQLAQGIADLYKASSATSYAATGMGKFNIPYRPSYLADVTGVFSPDPSIKDRIDWAREESVLSYHTARMARMAYSSALREKLTGTPSMLSGLGR